MPALQRSISIRGPRFFYDDGELMFVNHLDSSTREGPRPATKADSLAHPQAWAAFQSEDPDHVLKPVLRAIDPEGGPPTPEKGAHARRREQAET